MNVLLTCKPLTKQELKQKSHIILHCHKCGCHRKFRKVNGTRRIRRNGRPQNKYECEECGRRVEF